MSAAAARESPGRTVSPTPAVLGGQGVETMEGAEKGATRPDARIPRCHSPDISVATSRSATSRGLVGRSCDVTGLQRCWCYSRLKRPSLKKSHCSLLGVPPPLAVNSPSRQNKMDK